jgi:hypothetical protein
MATSPPSLTDVTLSSKWDGLSPHLIASFFEVERKGSSRDWQHVQGGPTVRAPLTECNIDILLNWQSPFENAGLGAMPSLKAMLASGALQPRTEDKGQTSQFMGSFEGRTGITKLNSTQVFSGMPPLKIKATALFRAWSDPAGEVVAPLNQLIQWALPDALVEDGPLLSMLRAIEGAVKGNPLDKAIVDFMMPSRAPVKIGLTYKGRTYSPLVIESIWMPMSSPVDANGDFVEMPVTMTICSLAAIDRNDWSRTETVQGFSA